MTDVVIVGAGPVGLMLACELALNGVRPLVLERLPEIDQTPKAGAVTGRGADLLDRRGLVPPAPGRVFDPDLLRRLDEGRRRPDSLLAQGKPGADHFAGMFVLQPALVGGPQSVLIPQQRLEEVLAERALALGVPIRRGHTVTDVDQDADGVTVNGGEIRARYLVGCDGGRSTVRKHSEIGFPGTDGITAGYQAIAEFDDPDFHPPGWFRKEHGLLVYGPAPGRVMTLEFDGPPADRDAPITAGQLQATLRRLTGTEVTVTGVTAITRFTDNARQAESYRHGRVLLAGDAAHVHSPWGGPGLRLGLGDAANLGWKLAACVRGLAGDELLATYSTERHPVAARALRAQRASVALLRPGPHVDALREVMGDLDLESYCPDIVLADGSRVVELQRSGKGLLLDLANDPALRGEAEGWRDRVDVVSGHSAAAPAAALLVRPDGYLAWTSGDEGTLRAALTQWFGISHS